MTDFHTLSATINGRPISFRMTRDPAFQADTNLFHYLDRGQMPEPEVCNLMARALKPGDVVMDAGANIGFFSLLMACLVYPDGLVYAIEPGPNNLDKLDQNRKLNNRQREICILPFALAQQLGQYDFYLSPDSGDNCLARHPTTVGQVEVRTYTIDALYAEKNLRKPVLIKLDIEGSERNALRGANELVFSGGIKNLVCELNGPALERFGRTPQDVRALAKDYGYDMFVLHPNGEFPTWLPAKVKFRTDRRNLNVLFSTMDEVIRMWPEAVL